jgi:hypothetical protein
VTTAQQEYSEHLIALRRAEVASELERQGYCVESDVSVDNQKADLVARKPGAPTMVYEFKLPANLHANSEQIRRLRSAAAERGFEFKLMVVTPPKRVEVMVEGLPEALDRAFLERLDSTTLASIARHVEIEDVSDVEIASLSVRGDHTDVAGRGVVDVRLDYGGGESTDGVTTYDSFPFQFDVTLSPQPQVVLIRKLDVDTSSFHD